MAFFQQLAVDLGVSERVRWLGVVTRERMPEHYQACDAFVLPSRGETFGIAFIEALAFGKPLIATRCGGPEDIVHADIGFLVPINSVDDLVVAMQNMMANAGRYMPQALRSDFLARFSASAALTRIESWYKRVIQCGECKVSS
jgi:glycosyltransferase involved in cell wall biosynthesis